MRSIPGLNNRSFGTVFCIGLNYQKHAAEMGGPPPDQPLVFLKPASSIIGDGDIVQLPRQSKNVHHEVELVLVLAKGGKNIPQKKAIDHIGGYAIGIDVTARDIQQKAKAAGEPWSVAKGFNTFAPISDFKKANKTTDFSSMELKLAVNARMRQHGFTRNMIFPVEEIIAYLSTIFNLQAGDLIFTGTPEGVSEISYGDRVHASLNNEEITLNVSVERDD